MDSPENHTRPKAYLFVVREEAEQAVEDLVDAGLPEGRVSLFTAATGEGLNEVSDLTDEGGVAGAGFGAAAGGVGGLLAGLGLIVIPGFGPLLGLGPIAAAMTGLIAGGSVGGFAGALSGLGISEAEAALAEEHVREGRAVLLVGGEITASIAATIKAHGGVPV